MANYPTGFSERPEFIDHTNYDDRKGYLRRLQEEGYRVQLNMMPEDVISIQALSLQTSIRTYCFNDVKRFGSIPGDTTPTEQWLRKGRLPFLLKPSEGLAGHGWTGPGTTEHVPDGDTTAAVRINEQYQGRGLATPFLGIIVDYTLQQDPEAHMWIEAWERNEGGIHVDKKLGFRVVDSKQDTRPTPDGGIEYDTRLFMDLPKAA